MSQECCVQDAYPPLRITPRPFAGSRLCCMRRLNQLAGQAGNRGHGHMPHRRTVSSIQPVTSTRMHEHLALPCTYFAWLRAFLSVLLSPADLMVPAPSLPPPVPLPAAFTLRCMCMPSIKHLAAAAAAAQCQVIIEAAVVPHCCCAASAYELPCHKHAQTTWLPAPTYMCLHSHMCPCTHHHLLQVLCNSIVHHSKSANSLQESIRLAGEHPACRKHMQLAGDNHTCLQEADQPCRKASMQR